MTQDRHSNGAPLRRQVPAVLSPDAHRLLAALRLDAAAAFPKTVFAPPPAPALKNHMTPHLPHHESMDYIVEMRIRKWMYEREMEARQAFKQTVLKPPPPPRPPNA